MADVGTRLVFENERVRVWEFTLQPGETVDAHRYHEVLVELKGWGRMDLGAAGCHACRKAQDSPGYRRKGMKR
jgi:quercetin dioxygenase-like cupin family protein